MLETETPESEAKDEEGPFDVVWEKLPHISLYQFRILAMSGYIGITAGFAVMYPVFAQLKPPVKCATFLDTDLNYSFLTFEEKLKITTETPHCKDYDSAGNAECYFCNFPDINSCEGPLTSYNEIYDCTSKAEFQEQYEWTQCKNFTFDRSIRDISNLRGEPWETAVMEFGLFCGKDSINALITSLGYVGKFFGAFIVGVYTDRFGRKNAMVIFTLVLCLFEVSHAFMSNVWSFMAFRTLTQVASSISWLSYIAYSVEVLGPSRRALAGASTHIFYSVGYIGSSLVGYLLPDWHAYTLCLGIISGLAVATFPFYPKSFVFCYSIGKLNDGRQSLEEFAKRTNTDLPENLLTQLNAISTKDGEKSKVASSIFDLFRNGKKMILISMNLGFAFLANMLVYNGLSLNAAQLPGNIYINNTINGIVELVAYLLCIYFLDRLGRRLLLSGLLIFGGIACFLTLILLHVSKSSTDAAAIASTWCSFLGKFGISGSFLVIYVFAAELYPTDLRSSGVSLGCMVGRIGSVVAPFVIMLPLTVANMVFGTVAVAAGISSLFLPETRGKPTLQTVDEAKRLYDGKPVLDKSYGQDSRAEL